MTVTGVVGAELAVRLAHDQLRALGEPDQVAVTVDWADPVDLPLADEMLVQAACGIMHVHGRVAGAPTPLAIDYASAVAGVLAAQGALAAVIARLRGGRVSAVRTSVAQAALLSVSQYLAAATCADPDLPTVPGRPPPFISADGVRFEIETLNAEDWQRFWRSAGAGATAIRAGWPPFLHRFATATCRLPVELHKALARLPYRTVREAGRANGVSVVGIGPGGDPLPTWTFTALAAADRPVCPSNSDIVAPLDGLLVVESARRVQGPLAGHVLRMLGADVLRIEPPGGDAQRGTPPMAGPVSARFSALNRGKRVAEIDLGTPGGRDEARDLVAAADVFLHNWAPGRAERWRLDAEDLAAVRPGLVYAHASGWGPRPGPLGTDYLVQAYSGLGAAVRPGDEPAAPSLMTLTDILGGLVCAQGILAALIHRERTGAGTRVDTSLLSAAGVIPRLGRPLWTELDRPIPTADGYLALSRQAARDPAHVAAVLGTPATCRARSTAELLNLLHDNGILAAAVTTDLRALAADPRFAPALDQHDHAMPRPPWEFS